MEVLTTRGGKALAAALMAISCTCAPANAQRAGFDSSRYNPGVLHVRFTPAEGRTTSDQVDSFLDLTLISASGAVDGFRAELSMSEFRQQLVKLYTQLSRFESLRVDFFGK